jgi:hypothetical protein
VERVTGIGGVFLRGDDQLRAEVDDRVEEQEFGRFGWAVDPEGNRFELWQPAQVVESSG